MLVAVVVGGPASIVGPALGALLVGYFQDIVSPDLPARISTATPLILGVLLIILMLAAPGGIAGLARQVAARVQVSRPAAAPIEAESSDPPPQPV
jgi:branched-chain amino acid transport system permease protein